MQGWTAFCGSGVRPQLLYHFWHLTGQDYINNISVANNQSYECSHAWCLHHLCLTVLSLSIKRNAKSSGQEAWLIVSSLLLSSIYWHSTHEKTISGQTEGPQQAEQQMLRKTRYLGIYPSLEMPSQWLENCLLASTQVPLFSHWNNYIQSGVPFSGTHKKGWDKGDLKPGEGYKEAEL